MSIISWYSARNIIVYVLFNLRPTNQSDELIEKYLRLIFYSFYVLWIPISLFNRDFRCLSNGGCQQVCNNLDGTFECACDPGFELISDKRKCNDINECRSEGNELEILITQSRFGSKSSVIIPVAYEKNLKSDLNFNINWWRVGFYFQGTNQAMSSKYLTMLSCLQLNRFVLLVYRIIDLE